MGLRVGYIGAEKAKIEHRYMYPKSHKKACGYNFLATSCFQKWFVSVKGCTKRGLPIGYHYFLPKID